MSASPSGRVPPHDLDAELALLAALLLDASTLDRVQELLQAEHFYGPANRRIFEACLALAQEGSPIDLITVASWLRSRERLADVGGTPYIAKIVDTAPEVANIESYARVVREKWRMRALIQTCQRISAEGYGDVGHVQTFIDTAEQAIYDLARTPESSTVSQLGDVIRVVFSKLEDIAGRGTAITGFPTGYKKLDELTSGLHPTDLVIVAARPGMGKTSFVLNIAINVAQPLIIGNDPSGEDTIEQPGGACAVFSLEMPREQIASRMVSSEARVDVQRMRSGRLSNEDWHNLTQAASFLSGLPIYIDDTPGITVLDVRSKVRRIQAELQRASHAQGFERKVGLVVIDYLQLMRGSDKAGSREQEISEISRGLKHLAKELRVPVIALSQLNRSVETRSDKSKRPQISDLRECVTGDTLVCLADGRRVPIRELVGQTPEVFALSEGKGVVAARSDLVWSVGTRPIFELHLASGHSIRATAKHRLYGTSGWVRVGDLSVGDRLGVVLSPRLSTQDTAASAHPPQDKGSEIFFDEVVSISDAGEAEVFDLTVPGPASWIADGVVSHNSGAIEQDADMIMFIYRDDYYNKETALKGIAEIIVAKQRNGPTGKALLRWDSACTRFMDLDPSEIPEGIGDE